MPPDMFKKRNNICSLTFDADPSSSSTTLGIYNAYDSFAQGPS